MRFQPPKYCLHRSTGRAYAKLKGKRVYFGKYGTPESHAAYEKWVDQLRRTHEGTGRYRTSVKRLCVEYLKYADGFYRDAAGEPTGEVTNYRYALLPLVRLFGDVACSQFGPLKLEAVRADLMQRHCRKQVNKHVYRIRRVFRWGVAKEMLPGSVVEELKCMESLRAGRSAARESKPVQPVPEDHLKAALPQMTDTVRAMVTLQLLTGARPGEIRQLRVGEIDTTGDVWICRPKSHKNAWRQKERTIFVGPQGQEILMEFIGDQVRRDAYVFPSPVAEGECYTRNGLIASIRRACLKAGVPPWTPGRLRHNAATNVNRQFGDIDAARTYLGHSERSTTSIYAERDLARAEEIARKLG